MLYGLTLRLPAAGFAREEFGHYHGSLHIHILTIVASFSPLWPLPVPKHSTMSFDPPQVVLHKLSSGSLCKPRILMAYEQVLRHLKEAEAEATGLGERLVTHPL